MEARDDDFVNQLFIASTHSFVFFFSNRGKVYVKKVYEMPLAARNAKGRAIVNFVGIEPGEKVAAITPVKAFEPGTFVTTITRSGQIKKTEVLEYENFREKGIIGVKIEDDDQLLDRHRHRRQRRVPDRDQDRAIDPLRRGAGARRWGAAPSASRRSTSKATTSSWVSRVTEAERDQVLAVCERGYGKRTPLDEFRVAEPRRQGHHPDRRQRAQRPGRRHRAGEGRPTR